MTGMTSMTSAASRLATLRAHRLGVLCCGMAASISRRICSVSRRAASEPWPGETARAAVSLLGRRDQPAQRGDGPLHLLVHASWQIEPGQGLVLAQRIGVAAL